MPAWVAFLVRLLEGVVDVINRKNKKDAADNPASTIAAGGSVRKSEKSFDDLAGEPERDRAE